MLKTRIDVMRHGEPEGGDVLRGRTDHALTDKGWAQARQRCANLLALQQPWQQIISSPLQRCRAFAEQLAEQLQIPCVIEDHWQEIDYGDWENQSSKVLWQQNPKHIQQLWSDPMNFCAPNGEAVSDFSARIEQAWLQTVKKHMGQHSLVVCHGGVMRLLLQQLLSMSPDAMSRFKIPFAALSQFEIDHDSERPEEQFWTSLSNHYGHEI